MADNTDSNTKANRLAGGFKIFIAPQTVGTASAAVVLPVLTGSSINWGTYGGTGTADWTRLPDPSNDVTVNDGQVLEAFRGAFYLQDTDADLVEVGISELSFEVKETDLDALNKAFASSLLGTGTGTPAHHTLNHPLANTDVPKMQLALQAVGPQGGWGQVVYFPMVVRTSIGFPKTGKAKVRTQEVTFKVLAYTGTTAIPEGATHKVYEQDAA